MKELEFYLKQAVEHQASDLFFVAGGVASEKHDGIINAVESERLMPEDTEKLVCQLYKMAGRSIESYLQKGDDDFSLAVPGLARFRVNTYRQRGSMAAVIRVVSFDIPDWQQRDRNQTVPSAFGQSDSAGNQTCKKSDRPLSV